VSWDSEVITTGSASPDPSSQSWTTWSYRLNATPLQWPHLPTSGLNSASTFWPGRGFHGANQGAGQRRSRLRHRYKVDVDIEVVEPSPEGALGRLPRRVQERSGQVRAVEEVARPVILRRAQIGLTGTAPPTGLRSLLRDALNTLSGFYASSPASWLVLQPCTRREDGRLRRDGSDRSDRPRSTRRLRSGSPRRRRTPQAATLPCPQVRGPVFQRGERWPV
jgi:hypothetical protein